VMTRSVPCSSSLTSSAMSVDGQNDCQQSFGSADQSLSSSSLAAIPGNAISI